MCSKVVEQRPGTCHGTGGKLTDSTGAERVVGVDAACSSLSLAKLQIPQRAGAM